MMSSLLYASAAKRQLADIFLTALPNFLRFCSCSQPYSISSKPLPVPINSVTAENLMTAPSLRENSRNASDTAKPAKSSAPMTDRMLVAFDFDKTIIDVNSDNFITQLFPDGGKAVSRFEHLQWTAYMQKVFESLAAAGVKQTDLLTCLEQIPFTEGMKDLVKKIKDNGHDAIIISDCNSVFIEHVLANSGLRNCFTAVFTNPSKFDDKGCLQISMFHRQNWCELSAINICKGYVLDEFIKQQKQKGKTYGLVAYVGDGYNDFCPMTRLGETDIAFPRRGYPVHTAILKEYRIKYKLKSRIIPWDTGATISRVLFP